MSTRSGRTAGQSLRRASAAPWVLGLVAGMLAGLYLVGWLSWVPQPTAEFFPPTERHAYVDTYDPPTSPVEVALNAGDGQAFAALASDPALRRGDAFYSGSAEAAYRAQRPLPGWIAWALSAGRPAGVPSVLGVIAVVGVGLLVAAGASLALAEERDPRLLLLLVAVPGVVADLRWLCPDVFGAGLALFGLVWWRRSSRATWPAVACFTLAGLTRETLLIVPLVVGLDAMRHREPLRRLLALAVAPGALAAWLVVVHGRFGAWPTDAGQGRLSLPFTGIAGGLARGNVRDDFALALLATLVVVALRRLRSAGETLTTSLVLGHIALASVLGPLVWGRAFDFTRVLLPLVVLAVVACLPRASDATEPQGTELVSRTPQPIGAR